MSEDLTPQEVLDRITAAGYDGHWSMTMLDGEGPALVWLAPDTQARLAAALLAVPEGIESRMSVTNSGLVFRMTKQWMVRMGEVELP